MTTLPSARATPRRRVALLLGGAAGYLDAVSYLALGLFTANMTGNTVLLGIFTGEGRWPAALRALLALVLFFAGASLGGAAVRRCGRIGQAVGIEAAALVAGVAYWAATLGPRGAIAAQGALVLVALFSVAMGIQSASVRRIGEHRVSTTYVTGTLTSLAADAAADLLRLGRARQGGAALLAGVWGSYLAGALAGGFAELRWSLWAICAPVLVLAVLAASDLAGGDAAAP